MINYYKELNIDPSLKGEALRDALKSAQRKWIQRTNAPDQKRRQEAETKVTYVDEALKVLLDEQKRAEYDKQLSTVVTQVEETEEIDINGKNVAEMIQYAWSLITDGRYPDAIMVARNATEIDGGNAEAWATLGYANYLWNNIKDAIYEYNKAIKLQPNNDSYYADLGNIYIDIDNLADAEDCARKAMHINSNSNYNKSLMATILYNKGDVETALSMLEELVANEPENESHKRLLAQCYYQKGMSLCHREEDYYYCVDKTNTEAMVDYMKKGKALDNDPEFDDKIQWGEKSLKKTFDKSKWAMFVWPVGVMLGGNPLNIAIGVILAAGMIYLSMRPTWQLTRRDLLGKKNWFDYVGGALHYGSVFLFVFSWNLLKNILSSKDNTKA